MRSVRPALTRAWTACLPNRRPRQICGRHLAPGAGDPAPLLRPWSPDAHAPVGIAGQSPRMNELAEYEERMARNLIGPPEKLSRPIQIVDYDPGWPGMYELEAARIRATLGERVVRLEHAGSTSVPGLPAKPIIDIVLEVPDSSDEDAYVPAMEAAGYRPRGREPEW